MKLRYPLLVLTCALRNTMLLQQQRNTHLGCTVMLCALLCLLPYALSKRGGAKGITILHIKTLL